MAMYQFMGNEKEWNLTVKNLEPNSDFFFWRMSERISFRIQAENRCIEREYRNSADIWFRGGGF